jgi:hypothetical protein
MSELTVKLPDATTPGFLRRSIEAEKYRKQITVGGEVDWDSLINFLLVFILEPKDRDEARELLLDLSREQYTDLLDVIKAPADDANPT